MDYQTETGFLPTPSAAAMSTQPMCSHCLECSASTLGKLTYGVHVLLTLPASVRIPKPQKPKNVKSLWGHTQNIERC